MLEVGGTLVDEIVKREAVSETEKVLANEITELIVHAHPSLKSAERALGLALHQIRALAVVHR